MRRKKYFLINPVWLTIAAVILLMLGIFLDIVTFDPQRRASLGNRGRNITIVSGAIMLTGYEWLFLGKLAKRYPDKKEAIMRARKLYAFKTRRNISALNDMGLSIKNVISGFSDGSSEFAKIESEWRTASKCLIFCIIFLLMIYPIEWIIWDCMMIVRPTILAWLGSIGF